MTNDVTHLRTLLEQSSDADLLREMIGFTAQRLMELEVQTHTGAAHGERSTDRLTHRNGYRNRSWDTRAGTVELRIPKVRQGSYFPGFLEPRRTGEKALAAITCFVFRAATNVVSEVRVLRRSRSYHNGATEWTYSSLVPVEPFLTRPHSDLTRYRTCRQGLFLMSCNLEALSIGRCC